MILILYYGDVKNRTSWKLYLFLFASVTFTISFNLGLIPGSFYETILLYPLIFSISIFPKTSFLKVMYGCYDQASLIVRNGSRGDVSPYTWFMITIPNALRCYTLVYEVKDNKMLVICSCWFWLIVFLLDFNGRDNGGIFWNFPFDFGLSEERWHLG